MFKLAAAFVVILGAASAVQADPITVTITSGAAGFFADGELTSFDMEGVGTKLSSDSSNVFGQLSVRAGDLFTLSGSINPKSVGEFHGFPAEVNGVSYPSVLLSGSVTFVTDPITAPAMTANPFEIFDANAPLVLTGHFNGYTFLDNEGPAGSPIFSLDITGHGVFHDGFRNIGDNEWFSFASAAATFNADPAPSPTPEPATLVLIGSVLAGGALRRRDRSTRS